MKFPFHKEGKTNYISIEFYKKKLTKSDIYLEN